MTISNTKTQVFISDLNKRIKLKEEEVVNKNREEKYFLEKIKDLEELLSENLTTENSPFIIDKINYAKNLNTSVLNSNNQLHSVKNVYVTDGSCMTSGGNQNPSITYMALTARAVSHAVSELKKMNI